MSQRKTLLSGLMEDEGMSLTPVVSPKSKVAKGSVVLQLGQFLDEWHYRVLHTSLGKKWNRKRVVATAIDVLMMNGLEIDEEEKVSCVNMDENVMIPWLVDHMSIHALDGFEDLTTHLLTVMKTVSQVRKGLEDSVQDGPEGVEAMDEVKRLVETPDELSLGNQLLKQACLCAAKEIESMHRCQQTWMASSEIRIDRLHCAAENAERCTQQLLAIEGQLEAVGNEKKAANKQLLMGMAEGNDKTLMHSSFSAWLGQTLRNVDERVIKAKFEAYIVEIEKKLIAFKAQAVGNIKSALMRSANEDQETFMLHVMGNWRNWVRDAKRDGGTKAEMERMQKRLADQKSDASANSTKFLAKMGSDRASIMISMVFDSWKSFHEAYLKDKDFEDQVKKSEQLLKDHMQKKKEEAKQVLDRMSAGTDSGLVGQCCQAWFQVVCETKKSLETQAQFDQGEGRLKSLQQRQCGNAKSVQNRVNEQVAANLTLRVFGSWSAETMVCKIHNYYNRKLEAKRRQLKSVESLFKDFARQLDQGLGDVDGESSGRTRKTEERQERKNKGKDRGNQSLPAIDQRHHAVHA